MMFVLPMLASLMLQDTNTVVSPRVRAMLDRFPPPSNGAPSVSIRFSRDTVWVGEQVELVTVTWFPKALRDRLKHGPAFTAPSVTGTWIARNQQLPIPVATRIVGGQRYDMYVSWQTVFPFDGGKIPATPAILSYKVPTSTAYFAPEDPKEVRSTGTVLISRPIPAGLAGELGAGPTAHGLRLTWRSPFGVVRAGAPVVVELAIAGEGNLTLWPEPHIDWPAGVHTYPEPTEQQLLPAQGLVAGEKRFRFTLVTDSAGVLTLPSVQYPYFDPAVAKVQPAMASAHSIAILPRATAGEARGALVVSGGADMPFASTVVRQWPAALIAVAMAPVLVIVLRRRRKMLVRPRAPEDSDPEAAMRAMMGTPLEAGPDHVVAALRHRGVPRQDAELVHRWLTARGRWRYGPDKRAENPPPPSVMGRVIGWLRRR